MSIHKYAHDVLRIGLSILFLWFGMSQLLSPADWVSWIPSWATSLPLPIVVTPEQLVLYNGGFETVLGALLALGFLVRTSALLLSLHLLVITFEIGYSPIGVRDLGLALSTLALAMFNPHLTSQVAPKVGASAAAKPPLF